MWHPLRLAEDFAVADVLTGGRVTFGVGRGYHTREVETFGSPLLDQDANRELFEEQVGIIFKARSEERRVGKECRSRWAPYQAEDGIRDLTVTGVQTCALPIYVASPPARRGLRRRRRAHRWPRDVRRGPRLPHARGRDVRLAAAGPGRQPRAVRGAGRHHLQGEIGRASCRERV